MIRSIRAGTHRPAPALPVLLSRDDRKRYEVADEITPHVLGYWTGDER